MSLSEGTHIEIEGNEVCIVRTQVMRRVKTDDFVAKMASMNPVSTGLQPKHTIFYQQWTQNNVPHGLYVVEWEPRRVSLNYKSGMFESIGANVYEVWFPWVQWYLHIISGKVMRVYITCTENRIKQMEDKLFRLPIPNHSHTGFCQGDVAARAKLPLNVQCEQIITDIITSIWNDDLQPPWVDFNLMDRKAYSTCETKYYTVRDEWNTLFADITQRRKAANLKGNVDEFKKITEEMKARQAEWKELELPLAQAWLATSGIPYWANKVKEEGSEFWRKLLRIRHDYGTFGEYLKQFTDGRMR